MKKKEEKVPFCFPLSFCVSLFYLGTHKILFVTNVVA
jgi:hypothetical protein